MKTLPVALAATILLTVAACGGTEVGTASPATTLTTASRTIADPTVTTATPTTGSSSSSTGRSTSTSSSGSSAATSQSSESTGGTDPVAAELVGRMIAGFATTTSLTGTISVQGGGLSGDQPLATFGQLTEGSQVTALSMEVTLPGVGGGGEKLPILLVDDRFFVGGVIGEQYGNTWVEITPDTTDPTLSELYGSLADSINSASVSQYVTFLTLARDTVAEGPDTVDGVETEKYTLTLDLTQLDRVDIDDTTRASLEAVVAQGITEVPCEYWIDGQGRLVRAEQTLDAGTELIQTVAAFSDFDAPLDIAVPDPATVVVAP